MKKLWIFLITVALLAAATGCNLSGNETTEPTLPPATAPSGTQTEPTDPPVTTSPAEDPEPIPTLPNHQLGGSEYRQEYRDVYYQIWTEYRNLLTEEQYNDWIDYYNNVYREQIGTEWAANRMLLVTFVQRYHISRKDFDQATANFIAKCAILDWDCRHIEIEVPNADIIYTFDDEIINEFYRIDAPVSEPPPGFTVEKTDEVPYDTPLPSYESGSIQLQDLMEDDYTFDRPYREAYYRRWVGFLPLLNDQQQKEYDTWVRDFQKQTNGGSSQEEMLLVAMIKHFKIPREVFAQAVAYYIDAATSLGYDLTDERYEAPNVDIIYTFDNEIINNYYRYE